MRKFSNRDLYEIVAREVRKLQIPEMVIHYKPKHKVRHYSEEIARHCLLDSRRTLTLMDVISDTTPEGATGIDLGAGTLILGLAFLNAGGGYLTAVEKSPFWAVFARSMAHQLGFADRMEVISADAKAFVPRNNIGYVICELVDSGLMAEPMVPVIQHIRQFATPNAIFVPERAVSRLAIYEQLSERQKPERLTRTVQYDDVSLSAVTATGIDITIELEMVKDGRPNTTILKTDLVYPNGVITRQGFHSLCVPRPVKLNLDAPSRPWKDHISDIFHSLPPMAYSGQKISLNIKYKYGEAVDFRGRLA